MYWLLSVFMLLVMLLQEANVWNYAFTAYTATDTATATATAIATASATATATATAIYSASVRL